MIQLEDILKSNRFEETEEVCPGCQNHCQVRCYHFQNGKTYFSGNNCERVYSNSSEETRPGVNMMEEKYRLLFSRRTTPLRQDKQVLTIGIPRGLGRSGTRCSRAAVSVSS